MSDTPVLIVGAGPTGLTLAVELARRGVPFRIIDQNPAPLVWDRATVVKSRTLEIADLLGLADEFLARGRVVETVDLYAFGKWVADIDLHGLDTRFPYSLSLPESDTESILTAELERLGGRVERAARLTGLEQDADGVRARIRNTSATGDPDEDVINADWLVGTDGLHSAVRDAIGDDFEGHDNPRIWAVVDARLQGWRHPEDHIAAQLLMPAVNPIPLKDGRWRIYFRPESRDDAVLEKVEAGLADMSPGATLGEHDEPRFFHTHSRVARCYRIGRTLVAGDAAHACSPIQGHGMNCGIQDAHNLGWKLALVAKGQASPRLLDSYEAERRPIAQLVVRSSDRAEATSEREDPADLRRITAELASREGNHRVAVGEAEIAHRYENSPIIDLRPRGMAGERSAEFTHPGQRVGDTGPVLTPRGERRLYELLRTPGHVLFVFAADSNTATDDLVRQAMEAHSGWLEAHVVRRGAASDMVPAGFVHDPTGALHRRLHGGGETSLCLIRPDGYLALRAEPATLAALDAYAGRVFS